MPLRVVSDLTTLPIETLSRIERGGLTPCGDDLQALARVYNVTDATLLLREVRFVPLADEPVVEVRV